MLSEAVNHHIELYRSMEFKYKVQAYMLHSFADFAQGRSEEFIQTDSVLEWAASAPSVRQRHDRLLTVRRLACALNAEDKRHQVPPTDVFGRARRWRWVPGWGSIMSGSSPLKSQQIRLLAQGERIALHHRARTSIAVVPWIVRRARRSSATGVVARVESGAVLKAQEYRCETADNQVMHCTNCGGVLDNLTDACPGCGKDPGGPARPSHAPSTARRSLPLAPRWIVGLLLAATTAVLVVVGVTKHRNGARASADAHPTRTDAGAPTTTVEPKGSTPAALAAAPELEIGDLLLKPRRNTDAILGRPKSEDITDCEAGDRGYAYSDESYVCTHNGNVILLSYRVKASVSAPEDALRAVGLRASVSAISLFATTYVWLHKRGNPLSLSATLIPSVTVFLGKGPSTVAVDMSGWQAIQTRTVPKPSDAVVREFVTLLQTDVPGVISGAEWTGSAVNLFVHDSWRLLSEDRKRSIIEAAHGRWPAVCTEFGIADTVASITIKDQSSKQELAAWSSTLGVSLRE